LTLERDPTFAATALDGGDVVLLAGVGARSNYGEPPNFSSLGSELAGIMRSTDGGATWQPLGAADLRGLTLTGLAARGSLIVVAAEDPTGGALGGVYLSADTGSSFSRISGNAGIYGLPGGDAFDLQGDPGNLRRFYVAIADAGVYV